jgi:hypothetical protein
VEYLRQKRRQGSGQVELESAHAAGVVAGLHHANLISDEEHGEWLRRVGETAGHEWTADEPSERESGSVLVFARAPRVVRFLIGPSETKPFHDGEVAIPLVDVCDDRLIVWWRIAPLPSASRVFGDDLRMLERDMSGIDDEQLRIQHAYQVRLRHLTTVRVTDELGTPYRQARGGSSGGPQTGECSGYAHLVPSLPVSADELTITIASAKFNFRL